MKITNLTKAFYACLLILISFSCNKEDEFLNAKPNSALAVPSTLADVQSLLQNEAVFNTNDPALGEIGSDDYYILPATLNSAPTPTDRNGYIWAQQVYQAGSNVPDWSGPYLAVYYANTALDALAKIKISDNQQVLYNQLEGTALFYRSIAFYNLIQTFALPYDSGTSSTDLGIPLRLSSDLNIPSTRATVKVCYDQIVQDLQTADSLLPIVSSYPTQPSQTATNGLLARVYLALGNYNLAYKYSNDCLAQFHTLTDYNSLTPGTTFLSKTYLSEDIYHSRMLNYQSIQINKIGIADSTFFTSYTPNDLRKTYFFAINNSLPYYKGTYDYKSYPFTGIATDEIYLIRAECNARLGNTQAAMSDLNTLLVTRWKTNTFVNYTATSADDALNQILKERRKELVHRGLRWTDLRRLNKDSKFAITLTRNLSGVIYTLPPNDKRYAWPIPDNEVSASGIQQNVR